VQGEALYSLVPAVGRDLLVLEETGAPARGQAGRLTWFLDIPSDAPVGHPLDLGHAAVRGWVLEQIVGLPAHAAPLSGRVIIHERRERSLLATLVVSARIDHAASIATKLPECNGRFQFPLR